MLVGGGGIRKGHDVEGIQPFLGLHDLRELHDHGGILQIHRRRGLPEREVVAHEEHEHAAAGGGDEASTGSSTSDDINDTLLKSPEKPTFILLKNMFYAAKTLDDKFVGVLHDRISAKDDTNLQSLLGRVCGYGKTSKTHVFTSMQTVDTYLDIWRDLKPRDNIIIPTSTPNLTGRMKGIVHNDAALAIDPKRALPLGAAMGGAGGGVVAPPVPKKNRLNEDNFESEWSEWFHKEEKAMEWWRARGGRARHVKSNEDGFLVCTAEKKGVQKMEGIEKLRSGKKTANVDTTKMDVGDIAFRRYVAYADINNKATARFCVHWVKRIA